MSEAGSENANTNSNNIIFIIEERKLYVTVATLLAKDNYKLSKLLAKDLNDQFNWNECKTKSENQNTTNEYKYFLELNFFRVNRLFVWVYSKQGDNFKRFKIWRYYLPKKVIDNYNVIINGKTLL